MQTGPVRLPVSALEGTDGVAMAGPPPKPLSPRPNPPLTHPSTAETVLAPWCFRCAVSSANLQSADDVIHTKALEIGEMGFRASVSMEEGAAA